MSVFGQRLKEVRELRSVGVYALAEQTEIDPATIYNWENGHVEWPYAYSMLQVANALDVSTDYLLGRTNRLSNEIGIQPQEAG